MAGLFCKTFILLFFLGGAWCKKSVPALAGPTGSVRTAPQTSLFQKYSHNPIFDIGGNVPAWRAIHAANVSILAPDKTHGNRWLLFMRGSGSNANGYHDNIGTLWQPASSFNPYGPWTEQAGNPNLPHGTSGTYDSRHVLDAAAVYGPAKKLMLYYMSRDSANRSGLCVAASTDDGLTFTKFYNNPLKKDVGPNDAVFYNNRYYLFYGDAKWNGNGFDEPLQIWLSVSDTETAMSPLPQYALKTGGHNSFDSYSVNGAKIFKVGADNRWFMLYQCSATYFDYPERFHCAYSTDLVHWTKVNNTTPLLTRGNPGAFDQGAIWTGSVIENNDTLYIYYEGWGAYSSDTAIRDTPYYKGANSRVGIASCSTADFLAWVNR